ncbi:hypothetical protein ACA910_001799 [Epithemia clementina (nom. ined.)]
MSTTTERSLVHYNNSVSLMEALHERDSDGQMEWMLRMFDPKTTIPQSVDREHRRLSVLGSYDILDTPPELEFESITQEAKEYFDVPIAVVSLVDFGRQWFKSIQGLDAKETPRSCSFCAHVVERMDEPCNPVMVIPDATKDDRFKDNPLVKDKDGLQLRFYAGAPLISPEGPKLGAFCIIDTKPRPEGLTVQQQLRLEAFARFAVYQMISRCA